MANSPGAPRMLIEHPIEVKDDLEERMIKSYVFVKELMTGLSERDINDVLMKKAHAGNQEEVQQGLLYGILVETQPENDQLFYRQMTATSRDACAFVTNSIAILAYEKWPKLNDFAQNRLLWVFRQMVKSSVIGIDQAALNFMRQIAGGDVSQRNISLIDNMLDILNENRQWVDKIVSITTTSLYTFLRVIADQLDPRFAVVRTKAAVFCASIMSTKWNECMGIGRDLIRLLQAVAKVPELEKIWYKILHNPKSLSPTFTGIAQLMAIKTPKKFLTQRLTPEMEVKLAYLTTKVKFGNHKRYQDWFHKQYLSTPESQSLRHDLIRFICVVIHPSNEMLQSEIIPRWAVIGWLLTTCTSNVAAATAKLALFWDWLFYDYDKDSIMNIEPAILVMQHSMKPHFAITVSLLDFLCRIVPNFLPSLKEQVKSGVTTALKAIVDKRVVPTLSPLFDSAKLDRDLRMLIRETFPQFCSGGEIVKKKEIPTPTQEQLPELPKSESPTHESQPSFSDDEDITTAPKQATSTFKPIEMPKAIRRSSTAVTGTLDSHIEKVNGEMKTFLLQMKAESDNDKLCDLTEKLTQVIERIEDDFEIAPSVAAALCLINETALENTRLPAEINEETLEDSIASPVFVIFRNVCSLPDNDPARETLTYLLYEMHAVQPRLGYQLLYYLKVGKTTDEKMLTYKEMANLASDEQDFKTFILEDLKLCQEDDMRLFTYILTDVYSNFQANAVTNPGLMLLICSTIDGTQLLDLMCQILQGHLIMFKKESVLSLLNHSLEWETIEQYFLWQLLSIHDLPPEQIIQILPKLEFPKHSEAVTGLLGLLKQKCPSNELMRVTLCREPALADLFVTSILKHWASEEEDKTAEYLSTYLTHSTNTPRKKPRVRKEIPSVEKILTHLDNMRQTCKNISFLTNETIQEALQQVQQSSSEAQKQRFSELFALILDEEDEEAVPSKRNLRQTAARRANNASPKHVVDRRKRQSDDSDDSDEDADLKPLPAKRRKRGAAIIEMDDSD